MLKKLLQLYWHEKAQEENHRTLAKNAARFKKHGFAGMRERIEKEYQVIDQDYVLKSILHAKYKKFMFRLFFAMLFFLSNGYVLFVKSELYESRTALLVQDVGVAAPAATLGASLLGFGSSSQLQDSKVVEAYLMSLDMYEKLDAKFSLSQHYTSDDLDFFQRRSKDVTKEKLLAFYSSHLKILYDEISGILYVAFSHVNPKKAREILMFLVLEVEEHINELNRKNAQKKLSFVIQEYEKVKERMEVSSKRLETYQNEHLLLDPSTQATATSGVISQLDATLTQKRIQYATLASYLNEDSYELKALQNEITEIKKTITKQKKELSGVSEDRLNKVLFEYEKLKLQLEFDTEVYKNALLQLETTKIDVGKEAKTLSIISVPNMPDGYTYPNKPKVFMTILILTLMMYGIFSMLISIIQDHKE